MKSMEEKKTMNKEMEKLFTEAITECFKGRGMVPRDELVNKATSKLAIRFHDLVVKCCAEALNEKFPLK